MISKHAILHVLLFSAIAASAADKQHDPSTFSWHPERSTKGPVLVAVSLKSQKAAVYRNGILIGECQVSTGKKGHETPTGVFHIMDKDADHHSSIYNNASMPFSERLTSDGVALHAGGLPGYPSSHGCIHLPYEFSKKLFGITRSGTTVVITNDVPDVHVSAGHHLHFRGGQDDDNYVWRPEASASGPVSLLYSSKDEKFYVLRGGVTIGEFPVKSKSGLFVKQPTGTSAFIFSGWTAGADGGASSKPHWIRVGGSKPHGAEKLDEWFEIDSRFEHLFHGLIVSGTNLVVTDQPVSDETRSKAGFTVLAGPREENAIKK